MYNPKPAPQNNQEALNNVWQHFIIERNLFGFDQEINQCRYRAADGAMCAIGCQLPNNVYNKNNEEKALSNLLETNYRDVFLGCDDNFLVDLQRTHDRNAEFEDYEKFKFELESLANSWELQIKENN